MLLRAGDHVMGNSREPIDEMIVENRKISWIPLRSSYLDHFRERAEFCLNQKSRRGFDGVIVKIRTRPVYVLMVAG